MTAGNALTLLQQANAEMAQLLPPADGQMAPRELQDVQATTAAFVGAITGMQQYLQDFANAPPRSKRQQLEQEVQALEQELSRAEQLLLKTDFVVQQWQSRCQELRAQHEAALTDGISNQPRTAPTSNG